jgi:hypothetical protein
VGFNTKCTKQQRNQVGFYGFFYGFYMGFYGFYVIFCGFLPGVKYLGSSRGVGTRVIAEANRKIYGFIWVLYGFLWVLYGSIWVYMGFIWVLYFIWVYMGFIWVLYGFCGFYMGFYGVLPIRKISTHVGPRRTERRVRAVYISMA